MTQDPIDDDQRLKDAAPSLLRMLKLAYTCLFNRGENQTILDSLKAAIRIADPTNKYGDPLQYETKPK